jgi:hypothetical protein
MIVLYDIESGAQIGTINAEQYSFLSTYLEEESPEDQDYYINEATIDLLVSEGADPALIDLLRRAMGTRTEMEIRWEDR